MFSPLIRILELRVLTVGDYSKIAGADSNNMFKIMGAKRPQILGVLIRALMFFFIPIRKFILKVI